MTTHNLHPAAGGGAGGNITNAGAWAPTGAATNWQATSDNSDSSYMASGTVGLTVAMAMDGYTLATTAGAAERCLRIQSVVRAGSSPGDTVSYEIGNVALNDWTVADTPGVAAGGSIVNLTGAQRNSYPSTPPGEWTQTRIDNLNFRIWVTNSATRIYQITAVLDVRTQPSVAMLSTLDTTSHWPAVRWTATPNDGDVQSNYSIHVFDLDVNATPVFTDTVGRVYTSGVTPGAATSQRISGPTGIGLSDGNYRAIIEISKDFNGTPWWSAEAHNDFTIAVTPATPTAVSGVVGTLSSNTPNVQAHVVGDNLGLLAATATAEFRLATNSGFTTNLRDFVAPASTLTLNGNIIATVPVLDALFQTTWYLSARTVDSYGSVSGWSSAVSFVVSHPPTTLNYVPTGGASVLYSGTTTFNWDFFDTSADDSQSAYQVVVVDPDGTTVVDTGKVTSTSSDAAIAIPAVNKDIALRWKVRVYDADDIVSAYSNYQSFFVADPPTVTITAPGATVTNPQPEIDWTFGASGSRIEVAWRVDISINVSGVLTGVYDTDWVGGSALSHILTTPAMIVNAANYVINVSVRDNTGLENVATLNTTTSWVAPDAPDFTVDVSQYDTLGFVKVTWANTLEDASWYSWRIYHRVDTSAIYTLVGEVKVDQPTYEFDDYLAPSNTLTDFIVVQTALRFGSPVESDRTGNEKTATPLGTKYWLIPKTTPSSALRFDIATAEDPTDEYEESEMLIYGRGRKIEQGTRWGYRSELDAHLLDNEQGTARDKRLFINALRASRDIVYVRTPFGDVITSVLGDVKFSRDVGRGLVESGTIAIPFVEVYE